MNLKKSLSQLEAYFKEEANAPEIIQHSVKRAAVRIASICAHPQDMTAEDLELIAHPIEYLSEIMDIVDIYEDEEQ